jgi:hypothetical protein
MLVISITMIACGAIFLALNWDKDRHCPSKCIVEACHGSNLAWYDCKCDSGNCSNKNYTLNEIVALAMMIVGSIFIFAQISRTIRAFCCGCDTAPPRRYDGLVYHAMVPTAMAPPPSSNTVVINNH